MNQFYAFVMSMVFGGLVLFGAYQLDVHHVGYPAPIAHTVPQMPTKIDVNGIQWRIQVMNQLSMGNQDEGGVTDCARKVIYLSKENNRLPTLLMHELSHAAVCVSTPFGFIPNNLYYNSSDSSSHEGIYHFTEIWTELLQRNPDLAAYLGSPIESSK